MIAELRFFAHMSLRQLMLAFTILAALARMLLIVSLHKRLAKVTASQLQFRQKLLTEADRHAHLGPCNIDPKFEEIR